MCKGIRLTIQDLGFLFHPRIAILHQHQCHSKCLRQLRSGSPGQHCEYPRQRRRRRAQAAHRPFAEHLGPHGRLPVLRRGLHDRIDYSRYLQQRQFLCRGIRALLGRIRCHLLGPGRLRRGYFGSSQSCFCIWFRQYSLHLHSVYGSDCGAVFPGLHLMAMGVWCLRHYHTFCVYSLGRGLQILPAQGGEDVLVCTGAKWTYQVGISGALR